MKRFKNKIVVITGAGSGIGRSTALRFDSEGADLLMIDKNNKDLEATKKMLKNKNSSHACFGYLIPLVALKIFLKI